MTTLVEGRNYTTLKHEVLRTNNGRLSVDINSSNAGGDASASNQTTMISHLADIETAVQGTLLVDGSSATQPVSASTLPLPTGASTLGEQQSQTTHLATIAGAVSGSEVQVDIVSSGTLNVNKIATTNEGSANNLSNNVTLANGADTSVVSVSNISIGNLFYEDSSTSSVDNVDIMVSADNTTYFYYTTLYPDVSGSVRRAQYFNLHLQGITHIKLTNTSSGSYSNVKATIVGSP